MPQNRRHDDSPPPSSAHLARYEELERLGDMPGLSVSHSVRMGSPDDAVDQDSLLDVVDRFCGEEAGGERRERFRLAWYKAYGIAMANRSGACASFPYDDFWSHSLARGVAAYTLARQLGKDCADDAFLCGFVYRMGAFALACAFPIEYSELMELRSLGELDELRAIERDLFGLDHLQTTHALLRDLGFPEALVEAIGSLSERPAEELGELQRLVLNAGKIADLCMLDEGRRKEMWDELVGLREELGLERDEFTLLGDDVVRCWWEFGDLLKIQTKAIASFIALDQTGMVDRASLGLPNLGATNLPGSPLRVLVVDDDSTAVVVLRRQLESGGYEVLTASNGAEALRCANEDTPDVVIADWMMPEMDGLDLCRTLRRCEWGRQLYFVLLTGRDEEDGMVEAFEAGVDDFVTKPSKKNILLARMTAARRVLGLRKQVDDDQRMLKQQLCRMANLAREAKDASVTDALTELYNRRYASRRLAEEWSHSERSEMPISLVMMDVDHFKAVNDTYGHDVGDVVLQQVARIIRESTRSGEVACRFGGEEFLVICRRTDEHSARLAGERIRAAIEERVVQAVPFDDPITVSVGVATRVPATSTVDELVKAADEAVYQAKAGGRNQVCAAGPPPALPGDPPGTHRTDPSNDEHDLTAH